MKKLSIVITLLGVFWLQSCKEIGPAIDFGPSGGDTAYTAEVEVPQTKKILAEEFTGVSCPPCPAGHAAMKAIQKALNDNVIVIAYHIFNYGQANPVEKDGVMLTKQDLRTEDATQVANSVLGGLGFMPEAAFDRVPVENKKLIARLKWGGAAEARAAAATTTPVNIHITSAYDDASREATIKVTLAYTETVDFTQNITVAIIEDSIIDAQKFDNTIVKDYVHGHALREIVTPVTGIQIPEKVNPKVAGKVYERTFPAKIGEKWNPEHCKVVVFVANDDASNREVVHVEEVHLKE